MNPEFEKCLKRGKIRVFSRGKALVGKELAVAQSDLEEAQESFKRGKYKWATIQCYYSMFHSARALIYNKNYRERSHHCLIVALRALYVETKQLSFTFVEALQKAKTLREQADYYGEFSKITAEELLKDAKEFLGKASEILKQEKFKS